MFQNLRENIFLLKILSKPNYKGSMKIKNRVSLDSRSFLNECPMHLFEGYASAKKGSQSRKQNLFIVNSNKVTPTQESKSVTERYRTIPCTTLFSIEIGWLYSLCLFRQDQFIQVGHKTSFNSQKCAGLTINHIVALIKSHCITQLS